MDPEDRQARSGAVQRRAADGPAYLAVDRGAGINLGLQTRIYFEDEDNESCPVLQKIEHRARVPTLIAKRTAPGTYRFDIILQGENETVFFDV